MRNEQRLCVKSVAQSMLVVSRLTEESIQLEQARYAPVDVRSFNSLSESYLSLTDPIYKPTGHPSIRYFGATSESSFTTLFGLHSQRIMQWGSNYHSGNESHPIPPECG